MRIRSYNADSGETLIYSRDRGNNFPIFRTKKLDLYESAALEKAFETIFQQGREIGMAEVAERVRRSLPVEVTDKHETG